MHPLSFYLFRELQRVGKRVWFDNFDMPQDLGEGMKEGVSRATVVVALISKKYALSKACMFELQTANEQGKRIVPVIVEPLPVGATDNKWWPSLAALPEWPLDKVKDEERKAAEAELALAECLSKPPMLGKQNFVVLAAAARECVLGSFALAPCFSRTSFSSFIHSIPPPFNQAHTGLGSARC